MSSRVVSSGSKPDSPRAADRRQDLFGYPTAEFLGRFFPTFEYQVVETGFGDAQNFAVLLNSVLGPDEYFVQSFFVVIQRLDRL